MPESEDGMKQLKTRVQIGTDANGKAIIKWIRGHSQQDLYEKVAQVLIESGQMSSAVPSKANSPVFNEYVQDWFQSIRSKQAPGRIAEETGMLKNYIYPFFAGKRLAEIKRWDNEAYFAQDKIQALATETAKKQGQMLNRIFELALNDGDINRNPATDYKRLLPTRVTKREALNHADAADIAKSLVKLNDEDRLLMSLFMYTGIRRGEALGLQVKHINPLMRQVSIVQAVRFKHNQPVVTKPKTKDSIRTIGILQGFPYELLEGMEPDAFVLGGASPWTETKFRRATERINKTIDLHGATAHVMRHTYATLLIGMGVDMKTVQGMLGHSTPNTTMSIYAHIQQESLLKATKQIGDIYSTAM